MKAQSAALFVSAVLLAGCHRTTTQDAAGFSGKASSDGMRVVTALTCPDAIGALKRTSQATDGRHCGYRSDHNGEDVALSLLPLGGAAPSAALQPVEVGLRLDAGPHAVLATDKDVSRQSSDDDHAQIDLPGLHIHAGGNRAQLRVAGMTINADGDTAHIETGGGNHAVVDAHPGGAEIRAGHASANGADYTLVLASDTPGPHGDKAVGYIARGPLAGPLVVATFRSKAGRYDGEDTDLKRLVDLNVKG